jgi:hypothetical protein
VPSNTLAIAYSNTLSDYVYTSTWNDLISTADNVGCPVTSCVLMDSTCSTTPSVNANFFIGTQA